MQRVDDTKRKRTVCVHWLKNQCKKNDACEYLHVYQEEKIPPCKYFMMGGECQKGDECVYRHITNTDKRTEFCPYYERGFCKKGL
jgi:cleavage and polyadenylation specificity factor subunit 4